MRDQNQPAPVVEPIVDPLEQLVRRVRVDAREEPTQYADETVVPEGGE